MFDSEMKQREEKKNDNGTRFITLFSINARFNFLKFRVH